MRGRRVNVSTFQRVWEGLRGLDLDRRRQSFSGLSEWEDIKMDGDIGKLVSLILEDIFIKWIQYALKSRRHNSQLGVREKERGWTFQKRKCFKKVMKINRMSWSEKLRVPGNVSVP